MTHRLTFPAPKRCNVVSGEYSEPQGKKRPVILPTWCDHPWTVEEVERAKLAGAHFVRGRHDFADDAAEEAALGKKVRRKGGGDVRAWMKKLSPEQLEILREMLLKEVS